MSIRLKGRVVFKGKVILRNSEVVLEGLQNLGILSVLRAIQMEEIDIMALVVGSTDMDDYFKGNVKGNITAVRRSFQVASGWH